MNVIARLEYELAYYDSAVHRFNHYTTRTPPSLCERWVGDWTELQHIDPHSSGHNSVSFLVLLGCSTGGLGAQPLLGHGSHSSIFSPTDLNFLSLGLYNNLTSTYFLRASQFALNSTPRQSRSPLISWYLRPDAPVIYTGAFLFLTAWPGSISNNRWLPESNKQFSTSYKCCRA